MVTSVDHHGNPGRSLITLFLVFLQFLILFQLCDHIVNKLKQSGRIKNYY